MLDFFLRCLSSNGFASFFIQGSFAAYFLITAVCFWGDDTGGFLY